MPKKNVIDMSNWEYLPAYPPQDYKGTQADWQVALASRGLAGEEDIPRDDWWEILEECEKDA